MLTNYLFEIMLTNSIYQAPFIGWALRRIDCIIHLHRILKCWYHYCAHFTDEVQRVSLTHLGYTTGK